MPELLDNRPRPKCLFVLSSSSGSSIEVRDPNFRPGRGESPTWTSQLRKWTILLLQGGVLFARVEVGQIPWIRWRVPLSRRMEVVLYSLVLMEGYPGCVSCPDPGPGVAPWGITCC